MDFHQHKAEFDCVWCGQDIRLMRTTNCFHEKVDPKTKEPVSGRIAAAIILHLRPSFAGCVLYGGCFCHNHSLVCRHDTEHAVTRISSHKFNTLDLRLVFAERVRCAIVHLRVSDTIYQYADAVCIFQRPKKFYDQLFDVHVRRRAKAFSVASACCFYFFNFESVSFARGTFCVYVVCGQNACDMFCLLLIEQIVLFPVKQQQCCHVCQSRFCESGSVPALMSIIWTMANFSLSIVLLGVFSCLSSADMCAVSAGHCISFEETVSYTAASDSLQLVKWLQQRSQETAHVWIVVRQPLDVLRFWWFHLPAAANY